MTTPHDPLSPLPFNAPYSCEKIDGINGPFYRIIDASGNEIARTKDYASNSLILHALRCMVVARSSGAAAEGYARRYGEIARGATQ